MDLGVVYNPRPWQHAFTLAGGMAGLWLGNHAQGWADWLGCLWCFGVSGVYAAGLEFRMAQEAAKSRLVFENSYTTPGAEQVAIFASRVQKYLEDNKVIKTGGNIETFVPAAQNVAKTAAPKQQLHPDMLEYQFVAETPAIDYLKLDIKKICKQQLTYRKHPELGHEQGDYREDVWVKSGRIRPRVRFTNAIDVLVFAKGIARNGINKNSSYITIDWDVIELGARGGDLPLPEHLRQE